MREIKFRAWDTGRDSCGDISRGRFKEMIYFGLTDLDEEYIIKSGTYIDGGCKIMQYTGLHDKNGKEIYEGDIVEAWDRGRKARFEVRYRNEGAPMFILYPAYQHNEFWNLHGPEDTSAEVIGNIYENPELLVNE